METVCGNSRSIPGLVHWREGLLSTDDTALPLCPGSEADEDEP